MCSDKLILYGLALVLGLVSLASQAAEPVMARKQDQWVRITTDETKQREYFTDLTVLDQDGRALKFYSDVLKNRIVLINFVFTNCEQTCPMLTRTFAKVQAALGRNAGERVHLISISVDAQRDTPAVLKRYAAQFGAKPGWHFITGKKDNVDWVIHRLGQWNEEIEAHSPTIMVADVKTGRWQALRGDVTPRQLISVLDSLIQP
jgi:protein SCO1